MVTPKIGEASSAFALPEANGIAAEMDAATAAANSHASDRFITSLDVRHSVRITL
jgi:hypothetical protein